MTESERRPLLVVDAANVIGSRPDGWWRDRPAAVRRLLKAITDGTHDTGDIVLVVEGGAREGVAPGVHAGVEVVHAAGSGDDEIVRVLAAEAAGPAPAGHGGDGRPATAGAGHGARRAGPRTTSVQGSAH